MALPKLDVRTLPGPETIRREELPNGVVVLARESFFSPSVVISGYLPAGSILDPPGKAGLAELTAAGLMRGTRARTFREIYDALESVGASLGFGATGHSTSFHGKALADDLGLLLGLLADVLQRPRFPKGEVEKLKGEKLTQLVIRDQDTRARAQMAFDELAYPGHPYSIPSDGYRDTVGRLEAADARSFYRARYGPLGMVVAVVGAVRGEDAIRAVEAALGSWKASSGQPALDLPAVEAPPSTLRTDVALPGKTQADIVLGAPGPSRFDPGYLAAALGNNILGRFGMMGRIGEAVRERAGLAYYAYSSLAGGPGPGPWEVMAGVHPDNVERAITLIVREIERFVSRRVRPEELRDSQANFIGRLPLQLESNEGVAGALVNIERYRLGLDYYQRFPDLVSRITRDQVLESARRFLDPNRLVIAVSGPPEGRG